METWLYIVIRQLTLYLLPVLISMTVVCLMEGKFTRNTIPHPFFSIAWRGTWWPFLASICFTRGIIFALPNPLPSSPQVRLKSSFIRFVTHLFLTLLGFLLYTWALAHQAPNGLPPLHHWWAKVFMYFNLCMLGIHLLPLPNLLVGEWIMHHTHPHSLRSRYAKHLTKSRVLWVITLLAASPVLDILIGGYLIFPIYEQLATLAATS